MPAGLLPQAAAPVMPEWRGISAAQTAPAAFLQQLQAKLAASGVAVLIVVLVIANSALAAGLRAFGMLPALVWLQEFGVLFFA